MKEPRITISAFNRYLMCDRKKRYEQKKTALKMANKFDGSVYQCPVCDGFHCTKKKARRRNANSTENN